MSENRVPKNFVKYRETTVFDKNSLPLALQKTHNTRPGIWDRANVLSGSIRFVLEAPEIEKITFTKGGSFVIEPEIPHHVELAGPVKLYLEFFRKPENQAM